MGDMMLQMMISVDGMMSGPGGEPDWIATDEALNRVHNENRIISISNPSCYLSDFENYQHFSK
jgi:hypothetical protein